MLESLFEVLLRFFEAIGLATQFAKFVGRVGVGGIDLQFLLKLGFSGGKVFGRVMLPVPPQKTLSRPVVNSGSLWIQLQDLVVLRDRLIVSSLAFVCFCGSEVSPDRRGS